MRHPRIHDLAAVGDGTATAIFIFVDAFGVGIFVERFGKRVGLVATALGEILDLFVRAG
jgi:hypothetical protein